MVRGLYAITPDTLDTVSLVERVRHAIAGGAGAVQYRGKRISQDIARRQAEALRVATHATGTMFIVNDNIDLALSVGADGVHLGRDDCDLRTLSQIREPRAKRFSSLQFLIGVSCYNEFALAETAVTAGADYIAFGSFFSSPTKPQALRADIELIRLAKARFEIPIVAIGGITVDNARQLISAKVDAVAVISGLFDAQNVECRAREFNNLFIPGNHVHK